VRKNSLNVRVTPQLHQRARVASAQHGLSLQDLVIGAVEREISRLDSLQSRQVAP